MKTHDSTHRNEGEESDGVIPGYSRRIIRKLDCPNQFHCVIE